MYVDHTCVSSLVLVFLFWFMSPIVSLKMLVIASSSCFDLRIFETEVTFNWRFIVWLFSVISWFFGPETSSKLGWISLMDLEDGHRWAERQEVRPGAFGRMGGVWAPRNVTVVTRPMIIAPSMIKIRCLKILKIEDWIRFLMDVLFFLISILDMELYKITAAVALIPLS